MAHLSLLVLGFSLMTFLAVAGERPYLIPFSNTSGYGDVALSGETADRVGEEWLLPGNVVPEWYNIRLLPFLEEGNFTTEGRVEVFVSCLQDTNTITLNVAEVTIDHNSVAVVRSDNNLPLNVEDVTEDDVHQMMTIHLQTALQQGSKYRITIDFVSYLTDKLVGFYRSSYVEDGVRKWLAITDFESTDARRAFPCFDEPQYKAVFQVTLGRKSTWKSASNMPLKETVPMDGHSDYVWDVFESSVRMQTYTVAFMVCEFDHLTSSPDLSNIPVSIWGRPDVREWMEYASVVGPKVLEFYKNYFEVDYTLPKLFMAAIPDLSPGAMENWGLITFQERYLLYDANKTTTYSKQIIAEIIAHEIAHMWTGNLVTMKWWNELWLNEGFAEYLQHLATNDVEPTFGELEQFVTLTMQPVLVSDSVPASRPINIPVFTPPETRSVFDGITYSKGASVIRMMADFLGEETFRRGMKIYLKRMSFQNAGQADLYSALEEQALIDGVQLPAALETIMDSWIFQMNYPLVVVERDYETKATTITQDRFLRIPDTNDTVPSRYSWWIPLTYKVSGGSPSVVWMSNTTRSMIVDLEASSEQWVIFNVDQKGYYRVKYDPKNYELIRDQLLTDHTAISISSRSQLLDDAFNLAILGTVSYSNALDLTLYLANERDYTPWEAVLSELDYIHSMFVYGGGNVFWERHLRDLVAPYFNDLGAEDQLSDPHLKILSRNHAWTWACKLDVPECQQNATDAFAAWSMEPADKEVISRNQKTTILCAGVEFGGDSNWQVAYDRFLNPLDAGENSAVLNAMSCTRNASLHARMLNMMLDESSGISDGNAVSLFNALARNPRANPLTFDFLRNQWDTLIQRYPSSMVGFVQTVSAKYNTQQRLDELKALGEEHTDVLADSIVQVVSTVQNNVDWVAKYSDQINTWLNSKY